VANSASNEFKIRRGLAAVAEVEERLGGFTAEEIAVAAEWAREVITRRPGGLRDVRPNSGGIGSSC
jgi:hypothetical protein